MCNTDTEIDEGKDRHTDTHSSQIHPDSVFTVPMSDQQVPAALRLSQTTRPSDTRENNFLRLPPQQKLQKKELVLRDRE